MNIINELQRRNVFRVGIGYLAVSWFLVQLISTIAPVFGLENLTRVSIILSAVGFLPALILAWIFQLTPEGFKLDKDVDAASSVGKRTVQLLDRGIIVFLTLALGYFAFDKFILSPERDMELVESITQRVRSEDQAVESTLTAVKQNSIAVLSFVDMSADHSLEYMSDGIAEELLTLLAKIPTLQVAARTSAFSFKGKDATIPEIGRLLNVAYVLEGSIRKSGDRIRITAQLITALTGSHAWAETYERELKDIFAVQDDIAAEIVTNLKVTMTGEMPSLQPIDGEAYALYLQARYLLNQESPESVRRSQELTTQVLALAPDYAPALLQMTNFSENRVEVIDLVNRALAIDPDYAPAIAALGGSAIVEGDLVFAAELISRAVALNPGDPDVLGAASFMNMTLGRSDVRLNEYIVARDPLNPSKVLDLSTAYYMAGREEEYVTYARKALTLSPDMEFVHYMISEHLLSQGDFPAALAEIEQEASEIYRLIGLICIYHSSGQQDKSDTLLQELIEKVEKSKDNPRLTSYVIAWPLAHRGESDLAFEYLYEAIDTNDGYLWGILGNRSFAPLYNDPRWIPFLEKIGRSSSQLDAIEFNVTLPGL